MLSGQISIVVNSYSFFSTQLKYNSLKDMSVDHLLLLLQLRSLRNAHHNTLYLPCFSLLECKIYGDGYCSVSVNTLDKYWVPN